MTKEELLILQGYDLDLKIMKSIARVREWVDFYGEDGVYISFSGGKDSTVLLHLVRELCGYKNIPAVFVDTGLEYPEIKEFVKLQDNITILRPKMSFKEVLNTYGYPVVSKEQANYLDDIRNTKSEKLRLRRLEGDSKGRFKLSKKWHYLIDAPFPISHKCCNIMKKNPTKSYEKSTGRKPILGTMAAESSLRKQAYLRNGCNAFESSRPISTPLGFWTESDILNYILKYNLKIATVYGDIICNEDGKLKLTGCDRTGCVFCAFGVHAEKGENRYQRLERTHPKLHKYCLDTLGFREVLDYMDIPHSKER